MKKFMRCAFFLFVIDSMARVRNPYTVAVLFSGDGVVPYRIADNGSDYIDSNDSWLAQALIFLIKFFYRDKNHDYY
jgi:hypothetical protein